MSEGRTLRPPYCDVAVDQERVAVGPADERPRGGVDHLLGDEIDHLQLAPVGVADVGHHEARRGREIRAVAGAVDELGAGGDLEHAVAALEHVQAVAPRVGDDDALGDIDVEGVLDHDLRRARRDVDLAADGLAEVALAAGGLRHHHGLERERAGVEHAHVHRARELAAGLIERHQQTRLAGAEREIQRRTRGGGKSQDARQVGRGVVGLVRLAVRAPAWAAAAPRRGLRRESPPPRTPASSAGSGTRRATRRARRPRIAGRQAR